MSKRKLEKDSVFKILVNDDQENVGDKFDEYCDRDGQSDSEEEHISEASEDDDDELSCESDIDLYKRKLRVRYVNVVKVQAKKARVLNTRKKLPMSREKRPLSFRKNKM